MEGVGIGGLAVYALICAGAMAYTSLGCDGDLPSSGGGAASVFDRMVSVAGFTACDDTPAWVSVTFFFLFTFPWFVLLASFLFKLAQVSLTGAAILALSVAVTLIAIF